MTTPANINTLPASINGLVVDGRGVHTDALNSDQAAPTTMLKAANAWEQASTNTTGGNADLTGGIGSRSVTVVDYSLLDDDTDTVVLTIDGVVTTFTFDTHASEASATVIYVGTSNATCATNLATQIALLSGIESATTSGGTVYIRPQPWVRTCTLTTTADSGEATVSSGTDGKVRLNSAVLFSNNVSEKWGFYIPATSGIATDGYHGGLAGCDQTLDVTNTQYTATYIQSYDGSTTTYHALEAANSGDFTQYKLFPAAGAGSEAADAVFFGATVKFCQLYFDMSATVQTYTGDATTWTYWNGTTWSALTVRDYSDATAQDGKRSFGRDGAMHFITPSDWAVTTVNSVSGYWIQCGLSDDTALNVRGITSNASSKGTVYTASPTAGFTAPQAGTVTALTIRDSAGTVHTTADIVFTLVNFTTGASTAGLTFAQDRRNQTFTGLTLACSAGDSLGLVVDVQDGTNEMGPCYVALTATLT